MRAIISIQLSFKFVSEALSLRNLGRSVLRAVREGGKVATRLRCNNSLIEFEENCEHLLISRERRRGRSGQMEELDGYLGG